MTLTEQITADLAANSNMNLIIRDLLSEHRGRAQTMKKLYNEYRGDVPIKGRIMPDPSKINEALANDYRGLIIDQAVGYLFGHPITYTLDKRAYTDEKDYMADHEVIQHFLARNDVEDLDADTGKYASICGYAGRLLYVDREGEERACLVPPWECIFVENESTGDIQAALRYFDVYTKENNATVCRTKVEYYDRKNVTVYLQDGKGHFYEYEPPTPHLFDGIPLIKFSNNTEEQGDFEKIANLIDAYDKTVSDAQNEIEEFRLAYLLLTGCEIDEDTLVKARQTGVIELPEGGDAKYLTKTLQTEFIKEQKETLDANIYKFARAVDFSDENFSGGAMSGEARKWKLLALENKAVVKERKFSKGLRQMFKVLSTAWKLKEHTINPEDIEFHFHRSLPVDLQYQAEVSGKLRGHVSERTRLEQLDFVPDVEAELQRIEEERNSYIDLDNVGE